MQTQQYIPLKRELIVDSNFEVLESVTQFLDRCSILYPHIPNFAEYYDSENDMSGQIVGILQNQPPKINLGNPNGVQVCGDALTQYAHVNGARVNVYGLGGSNEIDNLSSGSVNFLTYPAVKSPKSDRYIIPVNFKRVISDILSAGTNHLFIPNPGPFGIAVAAFLQKFRPDINVSASYETRIDEYHKAEIGSNCPNIERVLVETYKRLMPNVQFHVPSPSFQKHLQDQYGFETNYASRQGQFSHPNPTIPESEIQTLKEIIAPNGEIVLVCVGKVSPVKNLDFLIELIDLLAQKMLL